jgi:soluble lytic murein transglycosylase
MPATAEEMARRMKRSKTTELGAAIAAVPDFTKSPRDLLDPDINVAGGAYYLRYLQDRLDTETDAVLAYNGGMGRVRTWKRRAKAPDGGPLPPDLFLEIAPIEETRNYGRSVLGAEWVYRELYYKK